MQRSRETAAGHKRQLTVADARASGVNRRHCVQCEPGVTQLIQPADYGLANRVCKSTLDFCSTGSCLVICTDVTLGTSEGTWPRGWWLVV